VGQIDAVLGTAAGGAALPWWNPDGATPAATCGAWQAKGAASLAASYLNLAALGNANIDPAVVGGVAPTWATGTGWAFNGLTQYLKSGFIPQNDQSQSVLVQFSGVTNTGCLCLSQTTVGPATHYFGLRPNSPSVRYYNGSFFTQAPSLLTGNSGIAGNAGYRNGLPDAVMGGDVTVPIRDVWIGCANQNGSAGLFIAANIQAIAVYDVTLTAPQVLARATAMAAL
jgi:hypothetical protein